MTYDSLDRMVFDSEGETWEFPVVSREVRWQQLQNATRMIQVGSPPGQMLYGADRETLLRWHAAFVASFALAHEAQARGLSGLDAAKRFVDGDVDLVAALEASIYEPTVEDRSFSILGRTITFPIIPAAEYDAYLSAAKLWVQARGWAILPEYLVYRKYLIDDLNSAGIRFGRFVQALRDLAKRKEHPAMRAALFAMGRIASAEEFDSISDRPADPEPASEEQRSFSILGETLTIPPTERADLEASLSRARAAVALHDWQAFAEHLAIGQLVADQLAAKGITFDAFSKALHDDGMSAVKALWFATGAVRSESEYEQVERLLRLRIAAKSGGLSA